MQYGEREDDVGEVRTGRKSDRRYSGGFLRGAEAQIRGECEENFWL